MDVDTGNLPHHGHERGGPQGSVDYGAHRQARAAWPRAESVGWLTGSAMPGRAR